MNDPDKKNRRIPIFVCSTWEDLNEHRAAVLEALHRLETTVRGMEYFGSKPGSSIEECLKSVRSCEIFIGIFGMRYGQEDPATGKSISHLEYCESQRLGMLTLIYLLDENKQPVLPKFIDTGEKAIKLVNLKHELRQNFMVSFFTTPENLARRVSQDILSLLKLDAVKEEDKPTSILRQDIAKTFGDLLQEHRKRRNEELPSVTKRVKNNPELSTILPTDPIWYGDVEEGLRLVPITYIPALAVAYDIDVSLLQALAPSPETDFVHLRSEYDYTEVPLPQSEVKLTKHYMPVAKLAGSNTVVFKLNIRRGGQSLLHQHPGEEIGIVLKGKIEVKFPKLTGWLKSVVLHEGEILHFNSSILHQYVNVQGTESNPDSDAEAIAIRIQKH